MVCYLQSAMKRVKRECLMVVGHEWWVPSHGLWVVGREYQLKQ